MTPFKHPSCNHAYTSPPDWDAAKFGECLTLDVSASIEEGQVILDSFWQPSAEELAKLNEGRPVVLRVYGRQHPAVYVGVEA